MDGRSNAVGEMPGSLAETGFDYFSDLNQKKLMLQQKPVHSFQVQMACGVRSNLVGVSWLQIQMLIYLDHIGEPVRK
jgi:hypothetical protein